MYEEFFGLNKAPFTLSPDPSFLYLSKSHRMAITMLEYGLMNRAPISVVTGEVGCGKTTLLRRLLTLVPDDVVVGMVTHTHASFRELLQWIASAFDIDFGKKSGIALYKAFLDYLNEQYNQGRRVVLIVDEAQNLTISALEGIRLLSNVNVDADFMLQLVLVGQPELLDTMRRPELRQLAQRVSVDYHLAPLTEEETGRYIRHRLAVAGGDAELFDDHACRLIYKCSDGIPRLINTLCDMSLVYAYAEEQHTINKELVAAVIRDRQNGGVLPLRNVDEAVAKSGVDNKDGVVDDRTRIIDRNLLEEGASFDDGKVIDYPLKKQS